MNVWLGIILHAVGGLAAASFYLPNKKVKGWSWETYWLCQGFASWIIMPTVMALLTIAPDVLFKALEAAPASSMFWAFFFGALWGIGGLTFGLSMRYLGLSLGYATALGFCAAFGTVIPPVYAEGLKAFSSTSSHAVLAGVIVCLIGIAVCGYAGILKERKMTTEEKKAAIKEFALKTGLIVAVFAGLMSACMSFAIQSGKPIAQAVVDVGGNPLWKYNPIYIFAMAGGFAVNAIWCLLLNAKNHSIKEYVASPALRINYLWAFAGGIIWYLQFFFYGMGSSKLGDKYSYAGWTLHMAFIIIFSNLWGLLLKEWKGAGKQTHLWIFLGIVILIASTLIVGYGNYLDKTSDEAPQSIEVRQTEVTFSPPPRGIIPSG
ncbi:MAG: L-rhamnose/proton symporter RhaT [Sedimentisphaerales bacterium]|nr:L-rhamnose/proton symporter RhaT [Sedimentisphaerales bacterium]